LLATGNRREPYVSPSKFRSRTEHSDSNSERRTPKGFFMTNNKDNHSILPYWDQNLELNVPCWLPYGKDYSPVASNKLYNPLLGMLSSLALGLNSEFLYLHGMQCGNVGTMSRQNIVDPSNNGIVDFGFSMVFAWSAKIEEAILPFLVEFPGLKAGITICSIWSRDVLIDETKVVLLVNENPFFDEKRFISALAKGFALKLDANAQPYAFFAEKFGYRRFSISYETEEVVQMGITQLLFDMELDATREILGPAPELKIPPFMNIGE